MSVDTAFPTWEVLKERMSRVFAPPNQAYRERSPFLAFRQGKKELSGYFQESKTLLAAMQLDPRAEEVKVTIFMGRTPHWSHQDGSVPCPPSTFEEVVYGVLNAEISFETDCYGTECMNSSKDKPMDLIYAEDQAELQAA